MVRRPPIAAADRGGVVAIQAHGTLQAQIIAQKQ